MEKKIKLARGVDINDPMTSFDNIDTIFEKYLPENELKQVKRVLYGKGSKKLEIPKEILEESDKQNFEVKLESMTDNSIQQSTCKKRIVRIGCIQNAIAEEDTSAPIEKQRQAMYDRMEILINNAGKLGVNVLCLQEAWPMPFAFCTREKYPWVEFAECAKSGPSAKFISRLAKKWNMVIVSPILERDDVHAKTIWNTAVVFGNNGNYIGKSRKNHIPRVGDFNESTYYLESEIGHPVFETAFGKIGINICFGRHHPLNWMMYGLNGAEIVFNPSATVGALSEPMWGIEARNAAIANSYFSVAVNRVGTESFPNEFTSGDKKKAHKDFGHFYGSSYIASPDASRTSGLSRLCDGVLACDCDLNQCTQIRDFWMLSCTARHALYAKKLTEWVKEDYKGEIVKDPSLIDK